MATYYVDSNASGADDGTSFADAFASVVDLPTLSAGDVVKLASDHVDNLTADFTFGSSSNDPDFVKFISVNSSTEVYEVGADINSTNTIYMQTCALIGITIDTVNAVITSSNDRSWLARECTIDCNFIRHQANSYIVLEDCEIIVSSIPLVFDNVEGNIFVISGSISNPSGISTSYLVDPLYDSFFVNLIGVDLTGFLGDTFVQSNTSGGIKKKVVRAFGCTLNSNLVDNIQGTNINTEVEVINSISGTSTTAILQYKYTTPEGECELDTAVTRTGGASDEETSHTLQLTAFANETAKSIRPFKAPREPIPIWVKPGNTNLRLYLAHNAVGSGTAGRLQDDEFWVTYLGPSQAGTATALLHYIDSRTEFDATPSNLTDDSSSWSGTGVGTVQRVDTAINPTEAGYALVWLNFAPGAGSDTSIHVDVKIDVT